MGKWHLFGSIWPGGREVPWVFPAPLPVSHKGPCVHASHRNPRCLCPVGDHMCVHPRGDHACLHPTGKHTCVHPTGTRVSGHATAGAAPQPHARTISPGEHLQVTCGRGGVRVVRCTSPVDKQRDAVSRGCWFSATFVHTRVENRVCVGGCASKYRLDYLGSVLHSQAHSLQLAESLPRPAPPGAHWHRQQSSEQVIKRL